MDTVTLKNGQLVATVSARGAELISLKDAAGVERIWQGHPSYWSKHAPLLFPYAGAMRGDAYTLNGRSYAMGKHGFVRERVFAVQHADDESAVFTLAGDAARHQGFPFEYALRVAFSLLGNALRIETHVDNLGGETLWYSVGAHEAYACPEGIERYELVFDKDTELSACELEGSLLTHATKRIALTDHVLPIRNSLFDNDSVVLASHRSRSVTLRRPHHARGVRVDFDGFDYLLLWTQVGAGFLCIEPWHNLPDYVDADPDITAKPGILAVAPGEHSMLSHTITVEG